MIDADPSARMARGVQEPGLTLLPEFPYSGPLDDVRLKK